MAKISELKQVEFDGKDIDNCFYFDSENRQRVPMQKVFDWIKEKAISEGLTVELFDERIMFIS